MSGPSSALGHELWLVKELPKEPAYLKSSNGFTTFERKSERLCLQGNIKRVTACPTSLGLCFSRPQRGPASLRRRNLLKLLLLCFLLLAGSFSPFCAVVGEKAFVDRAATTKRKWKGPKLQIPTELQSRSNVPRTSQHASTGSRGSLRAPEEANKDSSDHLDERAEELASGWLSRTTDRAAKVSAITSELSQVLRNVSATLQQVKDLQNKAVTPANAAGDASDSHREAAGRVVAPGEGSLLSSISELNDTFKDAISALKRELEIVTTSVSSNEKVGGNRTDSATEGSVRTSTGAPYPYSNSAGTHPIWEPSTEEARRLAQYLLYRLMPHDPSYHILMKFYGVPTTPSRLARALPANVNRLWFTVLVRSFPTYYAHWAKRRASVVALRRHRQGPSKLRRRRAVHEEAPGWFVSTHRVTLHGFCFAEQSMPRTPCSGHIAAGLDSATVESLRSVLLENEALANFRLSGLGDLSRLAMLGRENELAAQRVIRLLLAEPSLFFKDHNTMAAVLMVVPDNYSTPTTPRGSSDDTLGYFQPRAVNMTPLCSKRPAGRDKATECTTCEGSKDYLASPCTGAQTRHLYDAPLPAITRPVWNGHDLVDRNVHMLIEMSGEGPGLDIRSFPRQIVQLISADDGDNALMKYYYPQEDYSPHDSIILNSSSGEVPFPTRKYIDASRIILQGTCRRVVSPTGTSTLLKTREFGVNLSQHQRRSVEMQLPESRILVHIEILGVPRNEPLPESPPAEYSLEYFTGPQFLSEHREEEPYTAADAAIVIRQRIADQFRHVWGNARVVLWEMDDGAQEVDQKSTIQEEGQPGKSDYQTWKILVAVLVPSFVVGALVVASWHSTTICKCGGSAAARAEGETSAGNPTAECQAEAKDSTPTPAEGG